MSAMVMMEFRKYLCLLLLRISLVSALWPLPQEYQHGSTVLWMHNPVDIIHEPPVATSSSFWNQIQQYLRDFSAHHNQPAVSTDDIVEAAIKRTRETLLPESFVPWKFHPRNVDFEPPLNGTRTTINTIIVTVDPNIYEKAASDESYTLEITEKGSVNLSAKTKIGALRGLSTFVQLFYKHSQADTGCYTPFAPLRIRDFPAFEHRGLNLDISRNYISPEDVIRTLDAMSLNKFNRLHLHASDAQSWPLVIPSLPDLATKGAYRPSLTWTTNDLLRVQNHGRCQGIEVYLEIDLPGHTASIEHAYPSLITAFNQQKPSWQIYSAEPPSGQLKLNSTAVTTFLHTLFADLLPRIASFSSYFHTGGDEINAAAYALDPTVNSSSPAVIQPLLQSFTDYIHTLTRSHGLTPIVWEEFLLDWNLTLGPDVIVQTWRSPSALASTVARGHRAIFGDHEHWYLDCGFGSWLDPIAAATSCTSSPSKLKPPYLDYCTPLKNWRHIYSYDPLASIPERNRHRVLGGEVHLWGELTDGVSLDGMLWPRAAAAAEVLWTGGRRGVDEGVTRRLAEMRERLVRKRVGAGVVQMAWCLMNEGGCRL